MMTRRSLVSVVLLLCFLFAPSRVLAISAELYSELSDKRLLTHTYDDFLTRFFRLASQRGDIKRAIQVGGPYQGSILNVYVLAAKYPAPNVTLQSIRYPYRAALRNFLALSPNTILIGEEMLAELMLTMVNDLTQALQSSQLPGAERKDQVTLASALAASLRIANLRNTTTRSEPDTAAIRIAPTFLQAERAAGAAAHEYFYHGLLFVLAHEIAHLDGASRGGLVAFEDSRESIAELRRGVIRAEERRADAVARKVIVAALMRDNNINNALSVYAVIGYFRDRTNLRLFDGFRAVPAENRLVSFRYGGCDAEIGRLRGYREDNIDLVRGGYWNILPILGKSEYRTFQDQLSGAQAEATHEHNFLRSRQILDDLERTPFESKWFVPIRPFLRFYEALLQDRPYLGPDHVSGVTPLSGSDVISLLGAEPNLDESPSCDAALRCQTGTFGKGFVDLMTQGGRVKYAAIYAPFLTTDRTGSTPTITYRGSTAAGTLRKMASHPAFAGRWPRTVTDERIVQDLKTCGVYSNVIRLDASRIEVTAVKRGAFLRFLIYPSQHDMVVTK